MIPSDATFSAPEGYIYSFPKVCFCDIPLSRVTKHMEIYQKFGIGLTKEWAKRKGLNPVLYVSNDSVVADGIFKTNVALARESLKIDDQGHETREQWEDAMRQHSLDWEGATSINFFVKPYEGDFSHNEKTYSNKRFYDEREWRYVPACDETGKVFIVFRSYWDQIDEDERSKIIDQYVPFLEFEPDDIRYIIVEKDDDVLSMAHEVLKIKSENKNYTPDQLLLLTTRIISAERIREDF